MSTSFIDRPYRDEGDYQHMRRLVQSIYAAHGPPVYCTLGDLDWWRCMEADPNAIQTAHLWFTSDSTLAAFAWPADDEADLIIHPQYGSLNHQLLAWVEGNRQQSSSAADGETTFRAWAFSQDTARIAALQEHSYRRSDDFFVYLTKPLDKLIDRPQLPLGYSIRHVQGAAELAARVAVHRAAFAPSQMSEEKYRAVMRAPTYRTDLDLVACAPDGSLAAFVLVWYDEANELGTFEPVGCHPDHQRRGLARALLHAGMRRVQELGARRAHVKSWGATSDGAQLYRHVGFTEVDRNYAWKKTP